MLEQIRMLRDAALILQETITLQQRESTLIEIVAIEERQGKLAEAAIAHQRRKEVTKQIRGNIHRYATIDQLMSSSFEDIVRPVLMPEEPASPRAYIRSRRNKLVPAEA